jgi:hypothetical protein
MRVKSGETVARIPLDQFDPDFQRAELRFEALRPPVASYEARVFIDEPDADARTPTDGNPSYLGTQYFYGVGSPEPAPPPSPNLYGVAGPTHWTRREITLNVTEPFRAYLRGTATHTAPLSLVAVDADGNEIPEPDLDLEGVSLVTS